jgi:hypothetical protein
MTAQIPEELINDNPEIDFEGLDLYDIVVWDETKKGLRSYPFLTKPSKEKFVGCTALWRGRIGTYRLTRDNELIFEKMRYPSFAIGTPMKEKEPDDCFEKLQGCFWLVFGDIFHGRQKSFFAPFVDGRLIVDKALWKRVNNSRDYFLLSRGHNLRD